MPLQKPLLELEQSVATMARKSSEAFARSIAVLETRDRARVESLRDLDKEIDQLELAIDRQCMSLLMKEPYAVDFRFVFSVAKMNIHLERVGDQSKTIGKWGLKLPVHDISDDMRSLAGKTGEALRLAVVALTENDVRAAERVLEQEFIVDAIEDRIIEATTSVAEAFIAKALERIGDLATNLAEEAIFMVDGRDVRHGQHAH